MISQRVFLFEYAVCTKNRLKPSIATEGRGMFKTLYEGFKNSAATPVSFYSEKNYKKKFLEYLEKAELALTIAPESRFLLYDLTKLIEKTKCQNLGSSSDAIRIASNKLLTSKAIKKLGPKTEVFRSFEQLNRFALPAIAKPQNGCGGEGIMLIKNENELKEKALPKKYILQEYIRGKPCSASLLINKEIKIISVQTQEIKNFKYTGAKIPIDIEEKNKEKIIKACEKIKGLHGFVGVDFVLTEEGEAKVIEINARPTAPIIALNSVFGFNISELILKNHFEEKLPEFKPKKKILMKKINNRIILKKI